MAVAAVPQNLVDQLRSTFLNEVAEKGQTCIHSKDHERVKQDDHWLRRFLAHNDSDIPTALKMMWTSLTWRKDFQVNDITESNIKMDIMIKGCVFPHGKDKDGKTVLIFKNKILPSKSEDLQRVVIYWMERLERASKGDIISIFFDFDGCGLSNIDLEFVRYLIGLFKEYYPFFLNLIIIFEMPWVMSAGFNLVKSWLPEKAIEKLKKTNKKDVFNYVPKSDALKSWGGDSDYVFSFIPEEPAKTDRIAPAVPESNNTTVKKVHFVDGSPMSEQNPVSDSKDEGPLVVSPSSIITFVKDGNELVSTLELQNTDTSAQIAYKLKTTSPEKFRVKPSTGCLKPGAKEAVTVTLLHGFQLGGLSKDKFLVMSSIVDDKEVTNLDLSELWKNTGNRHVYQTRLRCVQSGEVTKNGNFTVNHTTSSGEGDGQISKLSAVLSQISDNQVSLRDSLNRLQYIQLGQFVLTIILGISILYLLNSGFSSNPPNHNDYCAP